MKNNKGFSLIELIIVIAIMAILVGLMTPLLISYVEKTNVSSDIQLCDTIHTAVSYSIVDAKVVDDPDSKPFLEKMATTGMDIDDTTFLATDSVLKESLEDYIGIQPADVKKKIKSAHGTGCKCFITTTDDEVTVTFTETDRTGKKDKSNATPENDIKVE